MRHSQNLLTVIECVTEQGDNVYPGEGEGNYGADGVVHTYGRDTCEQYIPRCSRTTKRLEWGMVVEPPDCQSRGRWFKLTEVI